MSDNVAIILAGGKGERFGQQKQFITFMGKPLWKHVYDKAKMIFKDENIVVVGVDVEGGKTRSYSIINGINYFEQTQKTVNKVIILEAARPLVTVSQMEELLNDPYVSSTFVAPLINTVIKKDGTYVDRKDYFDLLTPQAFDFKLLSKAYSSAEKWDLTDETRLMYEIYGIKPHFIEGGQNLVKLTYIRDLPILENIAKQQMEGLI